MIDVIYPAAFVRKFGKLENDLQEDALEKIDLFKNRNNHKMLKVHKLKGKFAGWYSFSINYKYRIAFRWVSGDEALFLDIDDHDLYK